MIRRRDRNRPALTRGFRLLLAAILLIPFASPPAYAADTQRARIARNGQRLDIRVGRARIELALVRDNVLHVHYIPDGCTTSPTLVMAPDAPRQAHVPVTVAHGNGTYTLASSSLRAVVAAGTLTLTLYTPDQHGPLLRQRDLATMANRTVVLDFAKQAPLYGVDGYRNDSTDTSGIVRRGIQHAAAGQQGQVGAPFVWSTRGFGVLLDTRGALFDLGNGELRARRLSQPDLSYYLITGSPAAIFAALDDLSGHPQLFPKWAAGFTNSQWGIDQKELLETVRSYRAKHIPIDNFTLDFDWKAWGEDDDGEFRWNPVKFPDGPSGRLAKVLAREGIKLTGIMKPRLFVNTVEGRYATQHHLWIPGELVTEDYFAHKPVRDIDFDNPVARAWYGALTIKYAFDRGIVGWWNDEADAVEDDTQFLNMQRSLYDAQRRASDLRVWSLNRNFWLGSQRYAYGLWSGDIPTGFPSMAGQRERMLSAVDVGETLWSMDAGGYHGHPSDENYARWVEFGAFTPIFRVHGEKPEKRQPWRYGPIAEQAATRAIRLRYRLLPYIYSYFRQAHVSGVGLVRPLIFDWPHDPRVRNDVNAWMFGDWLLVSPIVQQGQTRKDVYLPAGTWTDYFTGRVYQGGQTVTLPVDDRTWSDIPLFVRAGAIVPTQPVMDYVGQRKVTTVTVDIFPSGQRTTFDYYDDDGRTYAYERGAYFLQRLFVQRTGDTIRFDASVPTGTYRPPLKFYLLKIHGGRTTRISADGRLLPRLPDPGSLERVSGRGWASGFDRFGPVTQVRIVAGRASRLNIAMER